MPLRSLVSVCVCVCVLEITVTHGVSSITLQTLAMVLRQSVVFSSGRVLFYRAHTMQHRFI